MTKKGLSAGSTTHPAQPSPSASANPVVSGKRPRLSPLCSDAQRRHPSLRRQTPWFSTSMETPRPPLPTLQPAGLCLHSSTHRNQGHPARAGPTPRSWSRWVQVTRSPTPAPSPASALVGGEGAITEHTAQRRALGGAHLPQISPTRNPVFPQTELQQLYLFHLSNYHIIKCMNYKGAKALN